VTPGKTSKKVKKNEREEYVNFGKNERDPCEKSCDNPKKHWKKVKNN
jgi:hypothetical protein